MMKITISTSTPAQLEAESLVAVVLDHSPASTDKNKKPELKVASGDPAVQSVAADLLASGEVSGKTFETNLMHRPVTLTAKRLLLVERRRREKVLQLRSAAHCRSRGARAQSRAASAVSPSSRRLAFLPKKRCGRSSKARMSAISIPTTIAATAKIRRLMRSRRRERR